MEMLSDFKLGNYTLVIDVLGVGHLMAESSTWLSSLSSILNTINLSLDKMNGFKNEDFYVRQYGDTVNLVGDDPCVLLKLSISLQRSIFEQGILAQMSISGGGAYDLSSSSKVRELCDANKNLEVQCLGGISLARGHMVLARVKGPRIFIDDESVCLPDSREIYQKVSESQSNVEKVSFPRHEVNWWSDIENISDLIADHIKLAKDKKEYWLTPPPQRNYNFKNEERLALSYGKEVEHLEAFLEVVNSTRN